MKMVCYFTCTAQSNVFFLLFQVDKVIEQLRGPSLDTSDVSYINASVRADPGRGMILPFEPLSMSFSEINYYVDMPAVCCLAICFLPNSVSMSLAIIISMTISFQ
jgi:hypothetical protein